MPVEVLLYVLHLIIMAVLAALRSRCGHYIFALWFLSSIVLSFSPHLISAVADWMSTILRHMMWPWCELRMHVWNVQHADRWKHRTQKSPSAHHGTSLSGYVFVTKARVNNRKKTLLNSNISPMCPYNMVNFGILTTGICWRVWGTPANFNGFRVLAALLHGIW